MLEIPQLVPNIIGMANRYPEFKYALTATLLAISLCAPSFSVADTKSSRLDELYQKLSNATQSESAAILRNQLGQALDESITLEQFRSTQGDRMADYLESQVRSAGNLENLLQAYSIKKVV
ncbi:MAG: hypothetical protein EBY58_08890 [Rhodobacteraceae bacterium]|nr:hypothetical protein [Paracoccaceae bacterium]